MPLEKHSSEGTQTPEKNWEDILSLPNTRKSFNQN